MYVSRSALCHVKRFIPIGVPCLQCHRCPVVLVLSLFDSCVLLTLDHFFGGWFPRVDEQMLCTVLGYVKRVCVRCILKQALGDGEILAVPFSRIILKNDVYHA